MSDYEWTATVPGFREWMGGHGYAAVRLRGPNWLARAVVSVARRLPRRAGWRLMDVYRLLATRPAR